MERTQHSTYVVFRAANYVYIDKKKLNLAKRKKCHAQTPNAAIACLKL